MGVKKEKSAKTKIEIQTRKPEKRGIFANLGNDRNTNDHPLREILNFPTEIDIQQKPVEISNNDSLGNPKFNYSDIQLSNFGDPQNVKSDIPNAIPLDSQLINPPDSQTNPMSHPKIKNSDSPTRIAGYPKNSSADTQKLFNGHPNKNILDSKISQPDKRISKTVGNLDSKLAAAVDTDSQNPQKTSGQKDWQKYDKKRKAKGVFLRTGDEITKKFKQFCIANDWDFSQGTELAWNKLMNDLDSQSHSGLDSLIAQDDRRLMMMFKTKVFIINLYLRYNSIFNELSRADGKKWNARWSPRDDEVAQRYNDLPPAVVELGILQTQIQKGFRTSRIQTFKYYTDEIEKVLASGVSDTMLETILNYHRQIWKNETGREVDLEFLSEKD